MLFYFLDFVCFHQIKLGITWVRFNSQRGINKAFRNLGLKEWFCAGLKLFTRSASFRISLFAVVDCFFLLRCVSTAKIATFAGSWHKRIYLPCCINLIKANFCSVLFEIFAFIVWGEFRGLSFTYYVVFCLVTDLLVRREAIWEIERR